jgi:hypothetical protein
MREEQKMVWAAVFGAARQEYGVVDAAELAGLSVAGLVIHQDRIAEKYGEDSEVAKYARTMGADLVTWGNQEKAEDDEQ